MPCALNEICHQRYYNRRTGVLQTWLRGNGVYGSRVHSHRGDITAMLTYICMTLQKGGGKLTSLISISFEKGGKFYPE